MRLVARHREKDVRLPAFLVRDDEELFEVEDALVVLLLIYLFHVGAAEDRDCIRLLAGHDDDTLSHLKLVTALQRVQIVGH